LKLCAEATKYLFLDFGIAIILPPIITVPIKHAQNPNLGVAGLVGLPDVLISFAILAWSALRNSIDANRLNESIKVMAIVFTFILGLANTVLALWEQNVTLGNFWTANNLLFNICMGIFAGSFVLSGAISIALGMQDA
jgi:hypothetical protein